MFHRMASGIATIVTLFVLAGCGSAPKTYSIGVISITPVLEPVLRGFKAGMAEAGYVEGRNVTYVYDGPTGSLEALGPVATNLSGQDVDLILSLGTPPTMHAKQAIEGTDIPVVFGPVNDPVASGLVDSLVRPGGNLTGIQARGFIPKNLEWLLMTAPQVKRVFVPHNPNDRSSVLGLQDLERAAEELGVELVVQQAGTPEEMSAVSKAVPADVDAIFVLPDSLAVTHIKDFVHVAIERNLPVSSVGQAQVEAGALMSYGVDFVEIGRQAATLATKIFEGAAPSDLPVETAEFFFTVNLRTAAAIGLNISNETLRTANHVVR